MPAAEESSDAHDQEAWIQEVLLLQARVESIQFKTPTFGTGHSRETLARAFESLDHSIKLLLDVKKQVASNIINVSENHVDLTSRKSAEEFPTRKASSVEKRPLSLQEYKRYGRQLILPEISLHGQMRIKSASVLIVGLGGLGCPAAAYLAGAGVGTIGLMDGDTVEVSNLHRQILHETLRIGKHKVDSAVESLKGLNSLVKFVPHKCHVSPQNALDIFSGYDIILDCTDHPTSRYLISDAAVILEKTVVSASALRTDGQLIILNDPPKPAGDPSSAGASLGGPCYRCIYPRPPPPESLVTCGEGGILGPVVGVMGVLQALETIKIIIRDDGINLAPNPSLLIFSAFNSQPFRSVKMRGRRKDCQACSSQRTIFPNSLLSGSLDYVKFCGAKNLLNILRPTERVSATDYNHIRQSSPSILVDVREKAEFNLCSLQNSINIPISEVESWEKSSGSVWSNSIASERLPIYVICRLGNDSQLAVKCMKDLGMDLGGTRFIGDIKGGFNSWREQVDDTWPEY